MKSAEAIPTALDSTARRFARYLNGPLGHTVLENLDEGESFILQTATHTLKVTKRKGRAVVELLTSPQKTLEITCE